MTSLAAQHVVAAIVPHSQPKPSLELIGVHVGSS
jgi:hypothetical protein